MKNVLKIILALVLVICLSCTFVACVYTEDEFESVPGTGNSNSTNNGDSNDTDNDVTDDTDEDDKGDEDDDTPGMVGGGGVAPGQNFSPITD